MLLKSFLRAAQQEIDRGNARFQPCLRNAGFRVRAPQLNLSMIWQSSAVWG